MRWIIGSDTHDEKQSKLDLLTVTDADREVITRRIKEFLELQVREVKLHRSADTYFEG